MSERTRFEDTLVTKGDKTQTVAEWATELGLSLNTIRSRRSRGHSWSQALANVKPPSVRRRFVNRGE